MEILCTFDNGTTSNDVFLCHGVKNEVNVIRSEANNKDSSTHENHPQCFLLLTNPLKSNWWLFQGYSCFPGTTCDGDHWNHKSSQLRNCNHGDHNHCVHLFVPKISKAGFTVVGYASASHDGKWQTGSPHDDPDGSTDAHVVPTLPVSGSEWLQEKKAPLKTDARQEENAGIHVEIFQIEAEQAKGPLEWPVMVDVIVNPER